jgi:Cu-Zn family superoxide dismutase
MRLVLLASMGVALCSVLGACVFGPNGPSNRSPYEMHGAIRVPMALATADGTGAAIGDVTLKSGHGGVDLILDLHGLPPGQHGFHLHANGSCDPAAGANGAMTPAGAAGAHFDPQHTNHHMGPMGHGHLGDLPLIEVGADGTAHQTLHVEHLHSPQQFRGHALMIHAGGDNYSDEPAPLGGGGARLACGVVS